MNDLSTRFFGERSVNWVALVFVVLLIGGTAAGVIWLFKRQQGRQTDVIRAQIALAEKGEGNEKLDQLYDRLLRFAPRDPDALEKYSKLLTKSAKTAREKVQALKMLDRAVRENPSNVELRQSLVELAMIPGFDDVSNPDAHLEVLRTTLPQSAEPCERLAARAEARGDWTRAEELLKEGLSKDKKHVASRLRLARLWQFRLNRQREAVALVDDLEKEARSAADMLATAEFWRDVGNLEKRRSIVDASLKAFPNDPDVLLAAAIELEERGSNGPATTREETLIQARVLLVKAIVASPSRQDFYVRLAYLDLRRNRANDARETIARGLKAIPGSFELRWVKCEMLFAERTDDAKLKEIQSTIEEMRGLEPRRELLQFLEARLAFATRQWAEAVQKFERVVPMLTKDPLIARQASLMLGDAYRELGEPVLREMAFRRLLVSEPLNVDAYLGLGESLAEQRRYGDAVSQLAPILRKVPEKDQPRLATTLLVSLVRGEAAKVEKQRQWSDVDRLLDEVQQKEPGNRLVLDLRVERLSVDGKLDEAVGVVDRFIQTQGRTDGADSARLKRDLAEAYMSKVVLLLKKSDVPKARAALGQGQAATGDSVPLRFAAAALECANGLPKDRSALDKLAEGADAFSERDRLTLMRTLAAIRHGLGDETGAFALYNRAANINPQDQSIQRARFLLALDLGDSSQAEQAAAALARSNSSAGSPAMCARALQELHGYEKTPKPTELRQHAVNLLGYEKHYGSWSGVPRAVARVAELEGKRTLAIEHYRWAYDEKAPNYRIARRLLLLNERAANYVEARSWLQRSNLESADPLLLKSAAEVAVRIGDFGLAKTLAIRAAPATTDDVELAVWAGVILQAARAPAEAERSLRRAIHIAPKQSRPLVALVEMLIRSGRKADARKEIEAASARLNSADLPLAKARCEEILGDVGAARILIEAAIARSPNDPSTLRAAVEFYARNLDFARALDVATRLEREAGSDAGHRAWAARMKGVVLVASGKSDEARKALDAIGPSQPDGSESESEMKYDARTRAIILAIQPDTKRWREALNELARLESLGLSESSDHLIAAQLEENLGDWRAAKSRLVALAERTQYRNPRALASLVKGMIGQGEDPRDVEVWLQRLERAAPNDLDAIHLRAQSLGLRDGAAAAAYLARNVSERKLDDFTAGMILVEMNDDKSAEGHLIKAAGPLDRISTPQQIAATAHLAQLKARTGRARDAFAVCQSLQSKLPPAVYAQIVLEAAYATADELPQDRVAEFAGWLAKQIEANPKERSLRLASTSLDSRLGRHVRALETLRKLKSEIPDGDPTLPSVLNNFAFLTAFVEKKPDIAERMLSDEIAKGRSPLEMRDTLGIVYLEQGKNDLALSEFQELSRLMPKAIVYFHLARAQAKKGDSTAARASFEKARRLRLRSTELHEFERPAFERLRVDLKL